MGVVYVGPEDYRESFDTLSTIFSMASMVFALISMLSHKYFGRKYKNSDYEGSLYVGKLTKGTLEEFYKKIKSS